MRGKRAVQFVANPGLLLDPLALALVVIGSLVVAAIRAGRADLRRAFAALRPMIAADPVADGVHALRAVRRIDRAAGIRSIAAADRVGASGPFIARAAAAIAEAPDADSYREDAEQQLDDRARRHRGAIEFWAGVADAAPALGLAGTVLGLIAMFARMDAPETMGPGMALALLTTLYGAVFANAVALPIARRLERLSEDELAWQRRAVAQLAAIAAREALDQHPVTRFRLTA